MNKIKIYLKNKKFPLVIECSEKAKEEIKKQVLNEIINIGGISVYTKNINFIIWG